MRYDVKKYLFVGTSDHKDAFFSAMQKAGLVDFIDFSPSKSKEVPIEIQKNVRAIKIVLGLPTLNQDPRKDYSRATSIIDAIISLKDKIDSLEEELRVTNLEIERIEVFGDFSIRMIREIEKEGNRRLQFFCTKQGHPVEDASLIYIGSDHGLDYYFSVNPSERQFEGMVEMQFDKSLGELLQYRKDLKKDIHDTEEELKTYAIYNDYLHHALTYKHNGYELESTKKYTKGEFDDSLFIIEGWIPVHKTDEMNQVIEDQKVFAEEIAIEEKDTIPTYLENHGTANIGEDLVHIYDTPSHEDKDPSMWVLVSFALFFAMIVNDAGYGLVFLGVALYLNYKFSQAKGAGKRFLKLTTILTSVCILWGTLMTSFFGISLDIDNPLRKVSLLQWLTEKKVEYHMQHQDETYQDILNKYPEVASETTGYGVLKKATTVRDEVISYDILNSFSRSIMLEIALLTGVIHISLSFMRYLGRNWSGIGWIAALIGGYLYFPEYLGATSMPHYAFGIPPDVGAREGMILMSGGFGLAVILGVVQNRLLGLTEITNVIQVFADVLSYLRLYALALASAIMAETINELSTAMPFVLAAILMVLAHIVNMALGIMGGVIHGLRLNFLEWYHYSFEGGGKLFKPLKLLDVD